MSAIVAAWRVMSVLSRAAAEHHGSRETVQRFSSAHLLRLTHFLKVELHRRFSSVLCTLIHSLFLCLFLTRAVSLVFSLNFSLPALFYFFFTVLGFGLSDFLFILCFLSISLDSHTATVLSLFMGFLASFFKCLFLEVLISSVLHF